MNELTTMAGDFPNLPTVAPQVPIMSRERFSELTGYSEEVIRGWEKKGHLPTVKIGRHRAINLLVLARECLEREDY